MERFLGKRYVMVSHDNFEDYLLYLGKGYLARKAALALRPEQSLTKNEDGSYTLSFRSTLANSYVTFTPGQSVRETRPDGVQMTSIFTIEDNKLITVQTEDNGKQSGHVREFYEDKIVMTTTAAGLSKPATRIFELLK